MKEGGRNEEETKRRGRKWNSEGVKEVDEGSKGVEKIKVKKDKKRGK